MLFKPKNCDLGLFKPKVTVFPVRTDPKPDNNMFILCFFAVNWLTSGFVYTTSSFNCLTRRLQTIRKNLTSERASNSDTRQRKMH